jgi:predicted enzyme related to lactoylglutathione lyase
MPKISQICLRCINPENQTEFYSNVLGMRMRQDGTIGYADKQAGLLFKKAKSPYQPKVEKLYWKISIAVPDIELACKQLAENGVKTSSPHQFSDVAYLAHFTDPEGFEIELLDHWFKGDRPSNNIDTKSLGGGPHLNLLTLRTHDIDQVIKAAKSMGMVPMSIVPVPDYGFTLYFYGYEPEQPPSPDLYSVLNRTWVYQRQYTVLEVLHRDQAHPMDKDRPGEAGYIGSVISGARQSFYDQNLLIGSDLSPE